jgi:predicted LPLAT superfamily acyltransferase
VSRGEASSPGAWHATPERGSQLGIEITSWLYRHGAKPVARALLWAIAGYFFATGGAARRASLAYLRRVHAAGALPEPPRLWDAFQHELEFARQILDRIGFWLGNPGDFHVELVGEEHLAAARAQRRGLLVLGAHLGSFDAMRLCALDQAPLRVNVLMYTAHAARINRTLGGGAPLDEARMRVIPILPGSLSHVIAARECVRRGEVVALLADRKPPGGAAERGVTVRFLGGEATLPESPFRLAAALGCPVVFMVGLRVGPSAYQVHVEPLAERVVLPRGERQAALAAHAQRFADALERRCLAAPRQWFNFFDFWEPQPPA